MKRVIFIFSVVLLIIVGFVSCNSAVYEKLFDKEFTVTYKPSSGVGEDYVTKTIKGFHQVMPNSELEIVANRGSNGSLKTHTGFYKKDFSFFGWKDEDDVYYQYDPNNTTIQITKDTTLEALWRNDLTGELLTGEQYKAVIKSYTGEDADTLIIPRVITLWDDPVNYPNGRECLVTTIAAGAVDDDTLKNVILPDTIEEIEDNAFSGCDNLETVEINSFAPPTMSENALPANTKIQVSEEAEEDYKTELPTLTTRIEKQTDTPITVFTAVTKVHLSPKTATLTVGETKKLNYTVTPGYATNQTVSFSSSDATVATVDGSGLVTGVAAGTATITVTTEEGGHTDTCAVTVTGGSGSGPGSVSVTGISLNTTSTSLIVGAKTTLTNTVYPTSATNKNVTWTTSNSNIATVNNGVVTAVAVGTTTITVTTVDGGFKATCQITVANSGSTGFSVSNKYPELKGTLSTATDVANKVKVKLNTTSTDVTTYMWYVDNRVQTGATTNEISLSESPWARTIKCFFSNGKTSGQATIKISGTQFD